MDTEFDNYAATYDGGQRDSWLKRSLGSESDFCAVKVRWLSYRLPRWPLRVLDYGCGTGEFLGQWSVVRPDDFISGYDESEKMLWQALRRCIPMDLRRPTDKSWFDGTRDVVLLSGVLHHVKPLERGALLQEVMRLLKPGGELVIFEHNPRNPLVRWVVRRTAIDKNAVLLDDDETIQRCEIAGFVLARREYLLFFPPSWRVSAWVERLLRWLPLGGQFAVTARKAE